MPCSITLVIPPTTTGCFHCCKTCQEYWYCTTFSQRADLVTRSDAAASGRQTQGAVLQPRLSSAGSSPARHGCLRNCFPLPVQSDDYRIGRRRHRSFGCFAPARPAMVWRQGCEQLAPHPVAACAGSADERKEARERLQLPESAFVVCSYGQLGVTKLNHRLLQAWLASDLARSPDCILVFVGELNDDEYGRSLRAAILKVASSRRYGLRAGPAARPFVIILARQTLLFSYAPCRGAKLRPPCWTA